MSESTPKVLSAGFQNLEAGSDTNTAPHLLPSNQCAGSVNATFRGTAPRQRPGYIKRAITFADDDLRDAFEDGRFQVASGYEADAGLNSILVSVSGRVYRIVPDDKFKIQDVTPTNTVVTSANFTVPAVGATVPITVVSSAGTQLGWEIYIGGKLYQISSIVGNVITAVNKNDTPSNVVTSGSQVIHYDANPSNILNGYAVQAENYWILRNGPSRPIIFNGSSCRRATSDEIKSGTVMAYAGGRIWNAVNNGYSFRATDLVRGPSGTAANRYRDSVLKETENTFLNEGGDFSVPGNSGGIRAMAVPANLDASMGQGPLQVFTPNVVFSVNAPIDRTTWKDVTYPIQTVSQISYGALGDKSATGVDGDIFYRSPDGFRSFKVARQDFAQWRMTPISGEEVIYYREDSRSLLEFGSSVVFDNRLLNTVAPRYSDRGVYHLGLAVLDFNLVSNMRIKLSPAWEGLWTGLRIFQIFKGRFATGERCFMFTLNNETDKIELWEVSLDEPFDVNNGVNNRIVWSLETRQFNLGTPFERKRLSTSDMYVDGIIGRVNFDLKYRPDSWPGWKNWHSWSECATIEQCIDASQCNTIANLRPQYRPRERIVQPINDCNNKRLLRDSSRFQFRLEITGPANIQDMRFNFQNIDESPLSNCLGEEPCESLDVCAIDFYGYLADS